MSLSNEICIRVRKKTSLTSSYDPIEKSNLSANYCCIGGDGSVKHPYQVKLTITNSTSAPWEGIIHIELPFSRRNPFFLLPGFMYGRNRGEAPMNVPTEFPRIREDVNRPASPWWMVRSDRLSHPAAFIFDNNEVYGFSTAPYFEVLNNQKVQTITPEKFYQYGGFTCNLNFNENYSSIGYTLGYENAPWLFIQSRKVVEREDLKENCFTLGAQEYVQVTLYVYHYQASRVTDIYPALEDVYSRYHQSPRKAETIEEAIYDLSNAVAKYAYLPEDHNYSGFVRENANGGFDYNKIPSISWTNGLSVAVPLLMAANHLKQDTMRNQSIDCITYFLEHSLNPASGLFYDSYANGKFTVKGWWYDGMHTGGHSAYLMGQTCYYILKAYEYEQTMRKVQHNDWIMKLQPVFTQLNKEKNTQYEYPFVYSEKNGIGLEYDSFGGCWCLAATAYYTYITKDMQYLREIIQSESHYYQEYVASMQCYGAPLDTDKAIDSEGILAYIRTVRYLHLITGNNEYLEHMRHALDYEFTFKFCYNVPTFVPPLSKMGWSSCGGSITSTANPHIHPMSSTIVGEMCYYVEHTNDPYVAERLQDVILWGCQTFNTYDKEYDFGKKGWMSERFCYSQGLLVEKYPDGSPASTWFALMPWASSSVIEGLVDYLQ